MSLWIRTLAYRKRDMYNLHSYSTKTNVLCNIDTLLCINMFLHSDIKRYMIMRQCIDVKFNAIWRGRGCTFIAIYAWFTFDAINTKMKADDALFCMMFVGREKAEGLLTSTHTCLVLFIQLYEKWWSKECNNKLSLISLRTNIKPLITFL